MLPRPPALPTPASCSSQAGRGGPGWTERVIAGKRNPHATRIVARAWLRVIWACWHTGTPPYNPRTRLAIFTGPVTSLTSCCAHARLPTIEPWGEQWRLGRKARIVHGPGGRR